ncbi:hypothetical protein A8F95_09675 [Bacillus wudalianchiensis]|uniref:Uncharacterized protein n=1 Tax=Pseudobacillus wudalianchiensis TaxID=1743143 RepID=A0A1B9AMA5_9BACI|nr:hypothetical protein A8F95_09675 [Bacillus wudalianchiensis]
MKSHFSHFLQHPPPLFFFIFNCTAVEEVYHCQLKNVNEEIGYFINHLIPKKKVAILLLKSLIYYFYIIIFLNK